MEEKNMIAAPGGDEVEKLRAASDWTSFTRSYKNTESWNEAVFAELTRRTREDALLAEHRAFVEQNRLGFGDSAFHAMWNMLVSHLAAIGQPHLLEIGVYKGQIVSLWALVLSRLGRDGQIYGISPLCGAPMPRSRIVRRILALASAQFRERLRNADFYENADYEAEIRKLFARFELDSDAVRLIRGLSSDIEVRRSVGAVGFDVIYIDGDHTYEGVRSDLDFYSERVKPGGYLVMDDAGLQLPGKGYWKGHPSVSQAVRDWENSRFENVLNCGHNRVFQRIA